MVGYDTVLHESFEEQAAQLREWFEGVMSLNCSVEIGY
jgi:hypothetical protein